MQHRQHRRDDLLHGLPGRMYRLHRRPHGLDQRHLLFLPKQGQLHRWNRLHLRRHRLHFMHRMFVHTPWLCYHRRYRQLIVGERVAEHL